MYLLLRLGAVSSYSFCKAPGRLKLQRARNFRAIRGYRRYLILRSARLSMTIISDVRRITWLIDRASR